MPRCGSCPLPHPAEQIVLPGKDRTSRLPDSLHDRLTGLVLDIQANNNGASAQAAEADSTATERSGLAPPPATSRQLTPSHAKMAPRGAAPSGVRAPTAHASDAEAIATAGGVAAGATAAGAIAGAVGATTFLGSTTLGGLVGGVLVVSTPVGWVIGCAVAGGAAAYGISRMIRSGGRQDEVRNAIRRRLLKRLNDLRSKRGEESAIRQLRPAMTVAINPLLSG